MKTRKTELDVDFIGGQEPMTIAEEKALSEYFKKQKLTSVRRPTKTLNGKSNRSKVIA
jgi:hypothetical protein